MKLKLDDAGHVAVLDGKPIYVADDGKEVAFDYAQTLGTITRLNGEAKNHRERAEAAETKLKNFDGIEDPAAALAAIEKLKDVDLSKMVHAGKLDEVKAEAKRAYEDQLKGLEAKYQPVVQERDGFKTALYKEIIGGSFSRSKFISEKVAIPAEFVQARFGENFTIEDGNRVVAKDNAGNKIFSRARPGEVADFDEALETLIETHSQRDHILKGSGASGGGAHGSGANGGGGKTMTRAQYDSIPPMERAAALRGVTLVD